MAKRIKTTKSKNSESYCIIDDYTNPLTHKRSTFIVEKLGSRNLNTFIITNSLKPL